MNEPVVVIEPTDSAIKIVVGYVLGTDPIILYAHSIPITNLIKNGNIVDIKALSNMFKKISHIEDKNAKAKFEIRNAILVLPPVGLEIYEDRKSTTTIANDGKISQTDLNNVVAMIKNGKIKLENSFVDIIPIRFYLSKGTTEKLPIGMRSSFLNMKAIIYTLPRKLLFGYKSSLESSGIKVNRCVIAPCAIAHLLANDKDVPEAFLFVDVGSSYTNIALISRTFVYNSSYFTMGGDHLTQAIAEAFNIDINEAEKIKRRYGYDSRMISFEPVIANSVNSDGMETNFTVKDLNQVIVDYFENYFYAFEVCLNKMLMNYPEEKRNFPIVVGGAASRLDGFIKLFKNKYPERDIRKVPLKVIGTRHERYLNGVGALLANAKYIGSMNNSASGVNKLRK